VRPAWLVDAQLVEQGAEFLPVLGHVDKFGAGSQDSRPRLVQADGQIVGQLSAHRHHHAKWLLAPVDLHHRFEAHLGEEKLVTLVIVGAHGLGVIVDHQGLVPEVMRRLQRVDAAPVKLHARADAVGARAQHHDLFAPRFL
jgi:hypothetical protein